MNHFAEFISPNLTTAFGETLMHSLWQLTALAGLLMLTLALVRIPRVRYRIATLTMTAMLIAPIATFIQVYEPAAPATVTASVVNTPSEPLTMMQFTTAEPGVWDSIQGFFHNTAAVLAGL